MNRAQIKINLGVFVLNTIRLAQTTLNASSANPDFIPGMHKPYLMICTAKEKKF